MAVGYCPDLPRYDNLLRSVRMTTKDDMSKYLERVQRLQRIAFAMANVQISTGRTASGRAYITVYVSPYAANGELEKTADGGLVKCYSFNINEWDEKEVNDNSMKSLVWLLQKMNVL